MLRVVGGAGVLGEPAGVGEQGPENGKNSHSVQDVSASEDVGPAGGALGQES